MEKIIIDTKVPGIVKDTEKDSYFLVNPNGIISKYPIYDIEMFKENPDLIKSFAELIKSNIRFMKLQPSFLIYTFNVLNSTTKDGTIYMNLIEEGYSNEMANKLAAKPSYESLGNGLYAGYMLADIVDTKYVLTEKGEVKEESLYIKSKTVNPYSWELIIEEDITPENLILSINDDTIFKLNQVVGLDEKQHEVYYRVYPNCYDIANYSHLHIKVIFSASQIVSEDHTLEVNSFIATEFIDNRRGIHLKYDVTDKDMKQFYEIMVKDWEDWKNKRIEESQRILDESNDFDVN